MAAAARSVIHKVSDSLAMRYPYNPEHGFEAQRDAAQKHVFDGMLPDGLDALIENLSTLRDPDVSEGDAIGDGTVGDGIRITNLKKALHQLVSHSISQEVKVHLIHRDVVPLVCAILTTQPPPPPTVATVALQLLRSLAIIPQGCIAVIEEGAANLVAAVLRDPSLGGPSEVVDRVMRDRESLRQQAALTMSHLLTCMAGRSLLLGIDLPEGLELPSRPKLVSSSSIRTAVEDTALAIRGILQSATSTDTASQAQLIAHAVSALAQLTQDPRGVEICQPIGLTDRVLEHAIGCYSQRYLARSARAANVAAEVDENRLTPAVTLVLTQLSVAAWNVSLVGVGITRPESLYSIFSSYIRVLGSGCTCASEPGKLSPIEDVMQCQKNFLDHFAMKRELTGALSAMMKNTKLKHAFSLSPCQVTTGSDLPRIDTGSAGHSPLDVLLCFLRHVNSLVDSTKETIESNGGGGPAFAASHLLENLIAASKNVVQTFRLASEVQATRDAMHQRFAALQVSRATETFFLRLQLYHATRWEVMFDAVIE